MADTQVITFEGERMAAMKVIDNNNSGGGGSTDDLKREVRRRQAVECMSNEIAILARLGRHPNIIRLISATDTRAWKHLIVEYAPHGTLHRHIERRQPRRDAGIPEREACHVIGQLVAALEYVHAHGVIHKDVKLDNVVFVTPTRCKLIDFGCACLASRPRDTGGAVGYSAPEVLVRRVKRLPETGITCKADVWSVGVVAYATLTGQRPFSAGPGLSECADVLYEKARDSQLRADTPNFCALSR
ncbi:MAG: protein kinase, partial [Planctomycetota bacterium]